MTWSEHAQSALRGAGLKPGGARSAVIDVLGDQECCLAAGEIHDEVRRRRPGVGIASVYRALETLTELGLVHRLDLRPGGARYEAAQPSGDHHHHLVCGDCGKVEAFSDEGLERAIQSASRGAAFRIEEHDVVLRGRCGACVG
ncbi:MAG TPA: Fur family transcriptional regulator [Gaiellaceae bacterium]|nr:Fur family transcriptional regulator [Gaiellaceae bacterium]